MDESILLEDLAAGAVHDDWGYPIAGVPETGR